MAQVSYLDPARRLASFFCRKGTLCDNFYTTPLLLRLSRFRCFCSDVEIV